jgi:hypothetical protein
LRVVNAAQISIPMTNKTLTWHWSFLRGAGGSGSEAVRAFGEHTTTDSPDTNGFFTIMGTSKNQKDS